MFKVGDIIVNSWGYDQTNIDAYQVVRATKSTVWMKPIATESVPGSDGFMSCQVKPVKDKFVNDHWEHGNKEIMKRIQYPKWDNGKPHISFKHGGSSVWDGESSFYCSWYA